MLRILIFLIMQILFLVGRKLFIGKLKGYTNNIGNMPHLTSSSPGTLGNGEYNWDINFVDHDLIGT